MCRCRGMSGFTRSIRSGIGSSSCNELVQAERRVDVRQLVRCAATCALTVAAVATIACATTPKPDPGEAVAVESRMQRYALALRSTNPDSVVAFYEPDGELVEPGMAALHGQTAIRA